jgi:hypothetical protein
LHLGDVVPEDHLVRPIDAALDLSRLRSEPARTICPSVADRSITAYRRASVTSSISRSKRRPNSVCPSLEPCSITKLKTIRFDRCGIGGTPNRSQGSFGDMSVGVEAHKSMGEADEAAS